MSLKSNFRYTKIACYTGYIIQAIVVNFAPLLFVTFNGVFHISLQKISVISAFNFAVQIAVDAASAKLVGKFGYRLTAIFSQIVSAVGLIAYGILPFLFTDTFAGIMLSTFLIAVGGGLIEAVVSPVIDACPSDSKSGSMALLHSFYCWGQAGVVLISTLFFEIFGITYWPVLSAIWAVVPIINVILFCFVPINETVSASEAMKPGQLFSAKLFPLLLVLMLCSGAAELGMAQWASAFAEVGLHIPKAVADIAGPCLFAILMGISRILYTLFSRKIDLTRYMTACGVLCLISYLIVCLSPYPVLNLVGCSLCGFSVGILWPGTLSIASKLCPKGGALMFGILALAGDVGCTVGTWVVGFVSGSFGDDLKAGMTAAALFPAILIISLIAFRRGNTRGAAPDPAQKPF